MANNNNEEKKEKPKIHHRLLAGASSFRMEFKKQMATAIMAAFGLIIALAWKDVINDVVGKFVPQTSNLIISAGVLTLVGVIGILIVSKWAQSGVKQ